MELQEILKCSTTHNKDEWLLSGYIKKGDLSLVGAAPGEGKTFFVLGLALHIVYGEKFLGRDVSEGSVLMIDHETDNISRIAPKIIKLTEGITRKGGREKGWKLELQGLSEFRLDNQATWTETLKNIDTIKPVMITIDSLRRCHNQKENDSHCMEGVVKMMRALKEICNSTIVVIHHFNKREKGSFFDRLRGSSVVYANADSACEIRSLVVENNQQLKLFGLIPQARKHIVHPPIKVRVIDGMENGVDYICMEEDGEYNPASNPVFEEVGEKVIHLILSDIIPQEWTFDKLFGAMKGMVGQNTLREVCGSLQKKNGILQIAPLGQNHEYRYRITVSSCPWCGKSSGF